MQTLSMSARPIADVAKKHRWWDGPCYPWQIDPLPKHGSTGSRSPMASILMLTLRAREWKRAA